MIVEKPRPSASLGGIEPVAVHVGLLGGFRLVTGPDRMSVSPSAERLVAFLALHDHPVSRSVIAGTFWPDVAESRSYSCLRSTLRRLTGASRQALAVSPVRIGLAPHSAVDLREARTVAQWVFDSHPPTGGRGALSAATVVAALSTDLLPGWYDDWVLRAAEEWRQMRIHALEKLADDLVAAHQYRDAVGAAEAAVRAEPLRESAQATLIRAHLAEGNQADALGVFQCYRHRLRADLGLAPTAALVDLMSNLRRHTVVTA